KGSKAAALSLGPAIGVSDREVSVEDLFPEDFYLKYVESLYKQQLAGAGVMRIALTPGDQLVKRVEAFFANMGMPFNNGSIAKRICADINHMTSVGELPSGTKEKVEALISAISGALD